MISHRHEITPQVNIALELTTAQQTLETILKDIRCNGGVPRAHAELYSFIHTELKGLVSSANKTISALERHMPYLAR